MITSGLLENGFMFLFPWAGVVYPSEIESKIEFSQMSPVLWIFIGLSTRKNCSIVYSSHAFWMITMILIFGVTWIYKYFFDMCRVCTSDSLFVPGYHQRCRCISFDSRDARISRNCMIKKWSSELPCFSLHNCLLTFPSAVKKNSTQLLSSIHPLRGKKFGDLCFMRSI